MKVHPLLIPHMLDMSPYELQLLTNGAQFRSSTSFWRGIQAEIEEGMIYPRKIGEATFDGNKLFMHKHGYNSKMKKHLMGASLDLFHDVPLAHRTHITGFLDDFIEFEPMDSAIPIAEIPRHTEASIAARRKRQAMEIFLRVKLHWMTKRMLDRLTIEQLLELSLEDFALSNFDLHIDPEGLGMNDPIKRLILSPTKIMPRLNFLNVAVSQGGVSLPGSHPNTLAASLPGQEATQVIDHWMFEGVKISKAVKNITTFRITFKAPTRTTSYLEDEPERSSEILKRLKKRETRATPKEVKDWERKILELDSERTSEQSEQIDRIHLYRNRNGKPHTIPVKSNL
jgi:hypothetical protein